MFSKLVSLFLILCIYNAAAVTYEEAFKACKVKFNIENDAPLDYFMEKGVFEAGKEDLKCFFECLGSNLEVKSPDGGINYDALKKLAQGHTHCQDLAFFGSDAILQACGKTSAAKESCDKVFEFIQCAINVKNSQPKSS